MGDSERPERLRRVYEARDNHELAGLYDEWAEDYERDVLGYGYLAPAVVCGLVGRYVESGDAPVLDAGAGTGLMGELLAALGYENLTGIDLSEKMLELAREKGVYRNLRRMELGGRLDFPDDAFAAVVAAGVFSEAHAPSDSFDDLTRVVRPDGCVVFSVREDVYRERGFREKQEALEEAGAWRLVEKSAPYRQLPLADPEIEARVFVYRVR